MTLRISNEFACLKGGFSFIRQAVIAEGFIVWQPAGESLFDKSLAARPESIMEICRLSMILDVRER
jgi:hypothetical protein